MGAPNEPHTFAPPSAARQDDPLLRYQRLAAAAVRAGRLDILDKIELRYLSRYVGILDVLDDDVESVEHYQHGIENGGPDPEPERITVFTQPSAKAVRLLRGLHPSGALVQWRHRNGFPDYTTIDGTPVDQQDVAIDFPQ